MDEEAGNQAKAGTGAAAGGPGRGPPPVCEGVAEVRGGILSEFARRFSPRGRFDPAAAKAWAGPFPELRAGFRAATVLTGEADVCGRAFGDFGREPVLGDLFGAGGRAGTSSGMVKDRVARQLTEAALSAITG